MNTPKIYRRRWKSVLRVIIEVIIGLILAAIITFIVLFFHFRKYAVYGDNGIVYLDFNKAAVTEEITTE